MKKELDSQTLMHENAWYPENRKMLNVGIQHGGAQTVVVPSALLLVDGIVCGTRVVVVSSSPS